MKNKDIIKVKFIDKIVFTHFLLHQNTEKVKIFWVNYDQACVYFYVMLGTNED